MVPLWPFCKGLITMWLLANDYEGDFIILCILDVQLINYNVY